MEWPTANHIPLLMTNLFPSQESKFQKDIGTERKVVIFLPSAPWSKRDRGRDGVGAGRGERRGGEGFIGRPSE